MTRLLTQICFAHVFWFGNVTFHDFVGLRLGSSVWLVVFSHPDQGAHITRPSQSHDFIPSKKIEAQQRLFSLSRLQS